MDADLVVSALTTGSLYALVAVSFNILYRPTNVFNFAQGDLVMLGAMFAASLVTAYGAPWIVGATVAMAAVAILASAEERIAVRPVIRQSPKAHGWVISTLSVSLIVANLVGHVWNTDPIMMRPPWPLSTDTFRFAGANLSSYQIALIAFTLVLVLAVERLYGTRSGKAIMAVAEDREAALLRGIDPDRLSWWSFALGGMVAGLTGVLAGPILYASTAMGTTLLLKGFAAAAVGGIGSNRGALIAGYLIGFTEAIASVALSPSYQVAAALIVMLAVLLVRPHGLYGRPEARIV
jgi:branched-chain amino acid transport system permease protein